MFENTTVARIYKKINDFKNASTQHINKKSAIYQHCGSLGISMFFLSSGFGIWLTENKNEYLTFISIILMIVGVLAFLLGFSLSKSLIETQTDSYPNIFKKISKKNELDVVYADLVADISTYKTQVDLIEFFNDINIDNTYLQLQFATHNYQFAIDSLIIMFNNKIIAEDSQKQILEEQEILKNYKQKLKESKKTKLRLVSK